MNAQWVGGLNLGPRAHPNDGLLDVYDARLGLTDVVKVRARARARAPICRTRASRSAACPPRRSGSTGR